MTPADLLDLRRRVAPLLAVPLKANGRWEVLGDQARGIDQPARWARTFAGDWLPVLDDPGTWGAMTARLVELAAARGWRVTVTYAGREWPAEVEISAPGGARDGAAVYVTDLETGVALAMALDEVADAG